MKNKKSELLQLIGIGHKNAVSRSELVYKLGMTDTATRELIRDTIDDGVLIVNAEDGCGYYIPETPEDIDIALRKHRSRIKKMEAKIDLMQRVKKRMTEGGTYGH